MALRTYTGPDGIEWRAWRVVPDSTSFSSLEPAYRDGWLVFERTDGTDRRRLSMAHVPDKWDLLDDAQLDALRRSADSATRRSTPTGTMQGIRRDKGAG